MDKVDHLKGSTILKRAICEGNIHKVDHLGLDNFKACQTWTKWTT